MIIETPDPGVEGVREAVERYRAEYPEYTDAIELYGAIMEAQQTALAEAACAMEEIGPAEIEARLAMGDPLVDALSLPIDGAAYRDLVKKICEAVGAARPGGSPSCALLASWDGLSDSRVAAVRDAVLKKDDLGFEPAGETGESDLEVARSILWEGLAPFYRVCGSILTSGIEQSSWMRGYCPVCGGAPLMGIFRQDDGLWLVECSLCHTLWNLQRAACPFCYETQGKLDYLYVDGDRSRRVNYCTACRKYVKTVDSRNDEEQKLLPLEDILTTNLDLAAEKEGLIRSEARF